MSCVDIRPVRPPGAPRAAAEPFGVQEQKIGRRRQTFNLAAAGASDASFHNKLAKDRDDVAAKMTPTQVAEAQRLASEWMESHPSTR